MKYGKLRRVMPFGLAVLFLTTMALKTTPTGELYQGADKLYHWIGFSVLTYTAHLAFPRVRPGSLFLWTMIGGASIELLQALSPSRTPSLADMTVNIVGILTGLAATQLKPAKPLERGRRRRHSNNGTKRRRSESTPQKEKFS